MFPLRSSTANGVRMPSRNPALHLSRKHLDVACEEKEGRKSQVADLNDSFSCDSGRHIAGHSLFTGG